MQPNHIEVKCLVMSVVQLEGTNHKVIREHRFLLTRHQGACFAD